MALLNGQAVSPRSPFTYGIVPGVTQTPIAYQGQPPMFGVVSREPQAPGGTVEIAWTNGLYETVDPTNCIDLITYGASSWRGKVIEFQIHEGSPQYSGVGMSVYERKLNGAGDPTPAIVLVKCFENGLYYEVPIFAGFDDVAPVIGR